MIDNKYSHAYPLPVSGVESVRGNRRVLNRLKRDSTNGDTYWFTGSNRRRVIIGIVHNAYHQLQYTM